MSDTIFDLANEELPEGQEGYLELAKRAPEPKDNSFLNSVKDYAKTFLKGSIEGVSRFGVMIGPTYDYGGKTNQQLLEEQTKNLDELLPTDEGYVQKSIRKGLREAPTMTSFPGSAIQTLPRSLLAGFLGEGAKELGAPEWAQTALELTAYIGPDITKKLISSGKNKEIIEFAKNMGMTDEQIAPLLQSEFKQKWLAKLSPKRVRTQTALKNTKSGLDNVYQTVQNSEKAAIEISEQANGSLINDIYKVLEDIPRDIRTKIEPDLADLLNNKITGSSLINFYKDVNSHLSGNTKQLSLLKEPIKKALATISPELAKDFEMVNSLYSKYYPISSKLKPTLTSDIVQAGEALGLMGAFVTGYYPTFLTILSEKSAKALAREMLINPHLQQLSQKMAVALNENKYAIVKKLSSAYADKIKKISPEASQKLKSLTEREIIDFLINHDQNNQKDRQESEIAEQPT